MLESSMLEAVKNCLIRRPKVRIALGLMAVMMTPKLPSPVKTCRHILKP